MAFETSCIWIQISPLMLATSASLASTVRDLSESRLSFQSYDEDQASTAKCLLRNMSKSMHSVNMHLYYIKYSFLISVLWGKAVMYLCVHV